MFSFPQTGYTPFLIAVFSVTMPALQKQRVRFQLPNVCEYFHGSLRYLRVLEGPCDVFIHFNRGLEECKLTDMFLNERLHPGMKEWVFLKWTRIKGQGRKVDGPRK